MLIKSTGEQKELACFERGERTEAELSCSLVWQNQLHIFGGQYETRQISRLNDYKLERIGDLSFDHMDGACTVMASQFIYLCFNDDYNDTKRCRQSTGPLQGFTEIALSTHDHRWTRVSCYDSKSFR